MKTFLSIALIILTRCLFASDTIRLTKDGFNGIKIGLTTINQVVEHFGLPMKIKKTDFVWALANLGGSCTELKKTKTFYRYSHIGLTFITTNSDTISGLIIYSPNIAETDKNIFLTKSKIKQLPKDHSKRSKPNYFGAWGGRQKFSEQANAYYIYDGINYGYKKARFSKKVVELRIGH